MKACISLAAAISVILMGGCQRSGFNMERYKSAVKDGFTKIPQACEIENLLGEADHFISYSGPDVRQDWNTEVYFAGRYRLTMQVEVKVDRDFSRVVEVIGEPAFYLSEIAQVELNANGTFSAGTDGSGQQAVFGMKEWNKIVQSKGDFSLVGVHIKKGQPVPNFEKFVEAMRRPRVRVRPDCGGQPKRAQFDGADKAQEEGAPEKTKVPPAKSDDFKLKQIG